VNAVDRARDLGAEHGRRDAEAWLSRNYGGTPEEANSILASYDAGIAVEADGLPEPDLSADDGYALNVATESGITPETEYAYCAAYRDARDETIRETVR
jgi:hypothetical protein